MKQGHLTEQRKHFVEAYCRLGNGNLAAKEAGYKDSPSLVNQASKLKRELSAEISEELRSLWPIHGVITYFISIVYYFMPSQDCDYPFLLIKPPGINSILSPIHFFSPSLPLPSSAHQIV